MEKIRCVNCMEEITGDVCPHCGYKEGDTEQTGYGLKRNSILHGKYLIGNVLGQGGFGITYIGFDIALELKVAIKEYFPMGYVSRDYTQSSQIVWNTTREGQEQWKKGSESFLKEARRMAKIDVLPGIVRVRDTFMENNTSYIVMDYVEGETLKSWLLKNGTMKLSDCVHMLSPLMQSLNKVHKRGLIHRDISPDNIMLQPDGEVRLLDLGAAKDLSIESNGTSQLVTKKGFSPSEQYMENGNIGTWTDVYALSATIYYCITGKLVPESMERVMGATLQFDVPLKEELSVEAVKTLHKGLAINAADRIQTVEELEQRLQKAIQPEADTKKEPERKQEQQEEAVQKAEPASGSGEKKKVVLEKEKAEPYSKPDELQNEPEEKPVKNKKKKILISAVIAAAVVITAFIVVSVGRNNKESSEIMTDNMEDTEIDNKNAVVTKNNILMTDTYNEDINENVLGSEISRDSIASVTFMDTLAKMSENAWDVSEKKNGSVMAWTVKNDDMYDLYIGGDGGVKGRDCYGLFESYTNVKKIDFNNSFDTSNVTDMSFMFCDCDNLTKLDLSSFDTSNVTGMFGMFSFSDNLTKLDLSSFDTSNVTNMSYMFYECENLTDLNLSSFDTSNVTYMPMMFCGCENLTELDVSGFDTSNVTDMSDMFSRCGITAEEAGLRINMENASGGNILMEDSLTEEEWFDEDFQGGVLGNSKVLRSSIVSVTFQDNLEGMPEDGDNIWDVSAGQDGSVLAWVTQTEADAFDLFIAAERGVYASSCDSLFARYENVKEINFNQCFHTEHVSDMTGMFLYCENLTKLDVSSFDTSQVTDMPYMFAFCENLAKLDVSGFDTSQVTSMFGMFGCCNNLTELDVSSFDTSNVTEMSYMFDECNNLTKLDVSGFDTSNVTDMSSMFYECENLTKLDVSGFDTSHVTDMSGMFYKCNNLTELDVSGFDTSHVTDMSRMFYECENLTKLDVSGFDTSHVTDMSLMFAYCNNLTELDVSSFDTSNVTMMSYMFAICNNLTKLDVSGFDTSNVTEMAGMFGYCENLTKLDVSSFDTSNVTDMSYMFDGCGITAEEAGLRIN